MNPIRAARQVEAYWRSGMPYREAITQALSNSISALDLSRRLGSGATLGAAAYRPRASKESPAPQRPGTNLTRTPEALVGSGVVGRVSRRVGRRRATPTYEVPAKKGVPTVRVLPKTNARKGRATSRPLRAASSPKRSRAVVRLGVHGPEANFEEQGRVLLYVRPPRFFSSGT